jgi:hypothetical protein
LWWEVLTPDIEEEKGFWRKAQDLFSAGVIGNGKLWTMRQVGYVLSFGLKT